MLKIIILNSFSNHIQTDTTSRSPMSEASIIDQHSPPPPMSNTLNISVINDAIDDSEEGVHIDDEIYRAAQYITSLTVFNLSKDALSKQPTPVTIAPTANRPPSPVVYPVLRSVVLTTSSQETTNNTSSTDDSNRNQLKILSIDNSKQCASCPRMVINHSKDFESPYCSVAHACLQKGCIRERKRANAPTGSFTDENDPYCIDHIIRRRSNLKGYCAAIIAPQLTICPNKAFGFLNELYCKDHKCTFQSSDSYYQGVPCYEQRVDGSDRCARHKL
jgi:hypothetical protein